MQDQHQAEDDDFAADQQQPKSLASQSWTKEVEPEPSTSAKRDANQAGLSDDEQGYKRRCLDAEAKIQYYEQRHTQMSTELSNAEQIIGRLKLERKILLATIGELLGPNYNEEDTHSSQPDSLLLLNEDPPPVNADRHSPPPQQTVQPQSETPSRRSKKSSPAKSTRKRKPDEPKRPKNAYVFYCSEQRARMNQNDPMLQGKFTEFAKVMGPKWKALGHDEKQKYIEAAEVDKQRYRREMTEYQSSKVAEVSRQEEECHVAGDAENGVAEHEEEFEVDGEDGDVDAPTTGPSAPDLTHTPKSTMADTKDHAASSNFLALQPDNVLEFRRPFTQAVVKQSLKVINNLSDSGVAFKVKTTAPKQYCVRPNSGRIPAKGSVEVQVLLQTMKEDPPLDHKCKDKFLVQAIRVSDEVAQLDQDAFATKLAELWSEAENVRKSDPEGSGTEVLAEKKLRCAYLPALSSAGAGATGAHAAPPPPSHSNPSSSSNQPTPSQQPPSYSPPSYSASTVTKAASSPKHDAKPIQSQSNQQPLSNDRAQNAPQNQPSAAARDSSQPTPDHKTQQQAAHQQQSNTDHKTTVAITSESTEKELRETKEQVKRLQQAVEGYRSEIERLTNLRSRRTGASGSPSDTAGSGSHVANHGGGFGQAMVQGQGGLPYHIVALVALISFILGILLF
ncbi:hypothetical protein SeMB42_g00206 [Synchytrium endobioticum]|uniref:HMG box domain-containing protein n=1 Tax=Synchytrium endobioticum TaxID=286115 RepID=A0A507DUJ4_9FUNG|nr:hypothetical protein SeMB42_g00206 [Synchytrium endobioticum]